MAVMKVPVFFPAFKQGRQRGILCLAAVFGKIPDDIAYIQFFIRIIRSTQGDIQQGVLWTCAFDVQCFVKTVPQTSGEGQRAAQVQDVPLDGASLGQAGNRLVDNSLIDGSSDIACFGTLIDQRLYIGLGKDTAAAGNGIGALCLAGCFIHLGRIHLQQGRHLVNESTRAAGTGSVHPHFCAVGQKQNLGIFTTELNDAVSAGVEPVGCHALCEHFLYKGYLARIGQAHARRAGNGQNGFAIRQVFIHNISEHFLTLFQDVAVMALII